MANTKAFETDKPRMPQQHVREGRGVPGYTGDVEVYETPVPKTLATDGEAAGITPEGRAARGGTIKAGAGKPQKPGEGPTADGSDASGGTGDATESGDNS